MEALISSYDYLSGVKQPVGSTKLTSDQNKLVILNRFYLEEVNMISILFCYLILLL